MKRLILTQYLGFVTIGFISGMTGPLLPAIRRDIPMTYGETGLFLSALCLGLVLTVPVVGYLADRYGHKPLLTVGGFILVCGLLGCIGSQNFESLCFWNILLGIGFGGYEVAINALCSSMSVTRKGNAMNLLHFFFGLGAMTGPLLSTLSLSLFHNWRIVFGLAACLPIIVILTLRPLEIPKEHPEVSNRKSYPYREIFLWVCAAFILVYAGIEISIQGWMAAYWERLTPKNAFPASLVASVFWLSLTIGRLCSGRWADRLGLSRFLIMMSLGCIVLALFWSIYATAWVTMIVTLMIGLLLAGIFPTLMTSAVSSYPGFSGKATAFISFFASLGGLFIPAVIGKIADWTGILRLPIIISVLAILMFFLAVTKTRIEKQHFPVQRRIVGAVNACK